jgi:hypothetical protein
MANARRTRIDLSEVMAGFDRLKAAGEPIARAMGVGMGQEVRDEAKIRAPVLDPSEMGTDSQQQGTLRDAIYLAFDGRKHLLNPGVYTYTVSWNSRRAPHGHLKEFGFQQPYIVARTGTTGLFYTPLSGDKGAKGRAKGHLRPNGPLIVAAEPFLGPAFDAKQPRLLSIAVQAGATKFTEIM